MVNELCLDILRIANKNNVTIYKLSKELKRTERIIKYWVKKLVDMELLVLLKSNNKNVYATNTNRVHVSSDLIAIKIKNSQKNKDKVILYTIEGSDFCKFLKNKKGSLLHII